MADPTRNPLFVPPPAQQRANGCPKCGKSEYSGRRIQGVVNYSCPCGNKWQGGLPQEHYDPRIPKPPQDPKDVPTVRFEADPQRKGEVQEIHRRPDPTQGFRKGAPIPQGED